MTPKKTLFLCTGNYYRSRFAELLFNDLAQRRGLPWRAESRGLQLHADNVGAISPYALLGLRQRGVRLPPVHRFPQAVTLSDLASADRVVALKESEHRPLLEAAFPGWAARVEFWDVGDLDVTAPDLALATLEDKLRRLMDRLE